MVGVESNARVSELKGPDRPVETQSVRLAKVLASGVVDAAAVLPERFDRPQHHRSLISLLRPTVLAISSHTPHQTEKRQIIEELGGRLAVVHEHNPEISTTVALQRGTMKRSG